MSLSLSDPVIGRQVGSADALFDAACLLDDQGDVEQAVAAYRRVIAVTADHAEAWHNLGHALHRQGRLDDAADAYTRALTTRPDMVEPRINLGMILAERKQKDEAAAAFEFVLRAWPGHADARSALADLRADQGRIDEAIAHYRRALDAAPADARLLHNLGVLLFQRGRLEEAIDVFSQALVFRPRMVPALYNLAAALREHGRPEASERRAREALALDPNHGESWNCLGNALKDQGRLDEALAAYRQALTVKPGLVEAGKNLLCALLYVPGLSPEALFAEHRAVETTLARPHYAAIKPFSRRSCAVGKPPLRRLKLGYLSSDFRGHPVGRNIMPVFEARDRRVFEVVGYAEVARPDLVTEHFKKLGDGWRDTIGMSDDQVADQIRADGIDILICLAGRFDQNRLMVCARKPAPVIVSFHDPATSGLEVIDYLISDPHLTPRATAERFTERVFRIPTFYAADPIEGAPDPGPSPFLERGAVTFGSANNPAKISSEVISVWAEILGALPDSRLRLKHQRAFGNAEVRTRFLSLFEEKGVAAHRLDFVGGGEELREHLLFYRTIDVALDPFPFTGSTTTFESLWMGVPVTTLAGATMVARWSAAMLSRLKRGEWVAETVDQYRAKTLALASDPQRLIHERASLRNDLIKSPLCNRARIARQLERAYLAMWRRYCARNAS